MIPSRHSIGYNEKCRRNKDKNRRRKQLAKRLAGNVGLRFESLEDRRMMAADAFQQNEFEQLLTDFGPETISQSVNSYLENIQVRIEDAIAPATELPLVGDQIEDGFEPFFQTLTGLREDLQASVKEAFESAGLAQGTNLVEHLQTAFFEVFGPQGLDILQDSPDPGLSITPRDIVFTAGFDSEGGERTRGTEWVQWELEVGQRLIKDLPFDFGIGLEDIFGFDAGGEVRFDLQWELQAGFGITNLTESIINPIPRPFLVGGDRQEQTEDTPELQLSVDVYAAPPKDGLGNDLPYAPGAPGLEASATIGLMRGTASDGTSEATTLTGANPINLGDSIGVDTTLGFEVEHADLGTVRFNVPVDTTFPNLISVLNTELNAVAGTQLGELIPFSVIPEVRSLDPTSEDFGASIKIIARTSKITGFRVTGGQDLGLSEDSSTGSSQGDDQSARHLGFENGQSGTGSVTASNFGPSEGYIKDFIDLAVQVNGTWVDLSMRQSEYELASEEVESLEDLARVFREHATKRLALAGFAPTTVLNGDSIRKNFDAQVVNGKLVMSASKELVGGASAPELRVGYSETQNSRISIVAGVDLDGGIPDSVEYDEDDQSTFNRIYVGDIATQGFDEFANLVFEADASVRMHVDTGAEHITGFVEQTLGLDNDSLGLPSVSFDLEMDAEITRDPETGEFETNYGYQDSEGNYRESIVFANVQLDAGGLLETIAVPIANTLGDLVGPLASIIGDGTDATQSLLYEPLPLVSEFGDDVTLADVLGEDLTDGIDGIIGALGSLFGFVESIGGFLEDFDGEPIDVGCYEYSLVAGTILPCELGELVSSASDADGFSLDGFVDAADLSVDSTSGGFSIDILSIESVGNMLVGNPFDIISYSLPSLDFEAALDVGFEFFGGAVAFDLEVGAGIQIAEMGLGYDSSGLAKIMDAYRNETSPNWLDLVDGVYVKNVEGPEVSINVFGDLFVSLGFFADVHLNTFLELDIQDPNEDGKFRLDEVFEVTNDFSNPENLICMFDIAGGLSAGLEVGIGPLSTGFDFAGALSLQGLLENLLGIDCTETTEPILATPIMQDGERVLRINTGTYANERLFGDTDDNSDPVWRIKEGTPGDGRLELIAPDGTKTVFNETSTNVFETDADESKITKKAGGYSRELNDLLRTTQEYSSDGRIIFVSDEFERTREYKYDSNKQLDEIVIDRGIGAAERVLDYRPGAQIEVTQFGSDITVSGFGVSQIFEGPFAKIIVSGGELDDSFDLEDVAIPVDARGRKGNDFIVTGSHADLVLGGEGNDKIRTGAGDDLAYGGAGSDEITTGEGHDVLRADSGENEVLDAGRGNDRVLAGTGSVMSVSDGSGDDYIDLRRLSKGVTIVTGGGQDVVLGTSLNDDINASASTSVLIRAGRGDDNVQVHSGTNEVFGGDGADHLTVTSAGTNYIFGGPGENGLRVNESTRFASLDGTLTELIIAFDAGGETHYQDINSGLHFDFGQGDDLLTVESARTEIFVQGNGGEDSLVVDRSNVEQAIVSELEEEQGKGLLSFKDDGFVPVSFDAVENFELLLGEGNDQLTINSTHADVNVVRGGAGNDRVVIEQMSHEVQVFGDANTDEVVLNIPGSPANFAGLGVTVESLEIDNSQSSSGVQWEYIKGKIYATPTGGSQTEVVDAAGAQQVLFTGSASSDSLELNDPTNVPQRAFVDDAGLRIEEGFEILQPSGAFVSLEATANSTTVDWLDAANRLASSPDGKFIYVTSQNSLAVSVYRRFEDTIGLVQVLRNTHDNLGLSIVRDVLVSPDGRHVYVTNGGGSISIFDRNAKTGRLQFASKISDGNSYNRLAFDDGDVLFVSVAEGIRSYTRNPESGALTYKRTKLPRVDSFVKSISYQPATGSGINGYLFITTSGGTQRLNLLDDIMFNGPDISTAGYDIATTPKAVYVSMTDGIRVYDHNLSSIGNARNAWTNSLAVTIAPDGDSAYYALDPATRPIAPFTLTIDSIKVNETSEGGEDELYFRVNGQTLWGPTSVNEPNTYSVGASIAFSSATEIEVWEEDNRSDDKLGTIRVNERTGSVTTSLTGSDGTANFDYDIKWSVVGGAQPDEAEFQRLTVNSNGTVSRPSSGKTINVPAKIAINDILAAGSSDVFATSFYDDRLYYFRSSFRGFPNSTDNPYRSIKQNDSIDVPAFENGPEYTVGIVSPDGSHTYSLNSLTGTLFVNSTADDELLQEIRVEGLAEKASIAISGDGQFVYFTNPSEDRFFVYSREFDSGSSKFGELTPWAFYRGRADGMAGSLSNRLGDARAVEVSGNFIYVASETENAITVFQRDTYNFSQQSQFTHSQLNSPASIAISGDGRFAYVANEGSDTLTILNRSVSTGALTFNQSISYSASSSTQGLQFSADDEQTTLYAIGADDSIQVFQRNASTGSLNLIQQVENNRLGVFGLDGLSDLAVHENNGFLFAAGQDASSIVVFSIDSSTGELVPTQRLRNGSGGVEGIRGVSSLEVVGDQLIAWAGQGSYTKFDVELDAPEPSNYVANHQGIESRTLQTAGKSDTFTVSSVGIPTGIIADPSTGSLSGDDVVVVDSGNANTQQLIVNLGGGNDQVEIRSGENIQVAGATGADTFSVVNSSFVTINGGDGDDVFEVDGTSTEAITLNGGSQTSASVNSTNRGDYLRFDTKGQNVAPANRTKGRTGTASNLYPATGDILVEPTVPPAIPYSETSYSGIEWLEPLALPQPAINSLLPNIEEGASLSLSAQDNSDLANTNLEWDLNGDGVFGDASGKNPVVAWESLRQFGVDDNGTYPIAVKASNQQGNAVASTQLVVTNTAPLFEIVETEATLYLPYTISLSVKDPGDDTIVGYTIDWGDGTEPTVVAGEEATATHVYFEPLSEDVEPVDRQYQIRITAVDEDNSLGQPYVYEHLLNVNSGERPATVLEVNQVVSEGSPFTLELQETGPLAGQSGVWTVDWGDGSQQIYFGTSLSVQHTYADDGRYRISGSKTYQINSQPFTVVSDNSQTVFAQNIAPGIAFSVTNAANEGSEVTLNASVTQADPGQDSISEWIIDWGDGTQTFTETIPAGVKHAYADDGQYQIRLAARDEDGVHTSPTVEAVSISNVAPVLTAVLSQTSVAEGAAAFLQLNVSDPGDDTVTAWVIDWGDGSDEQRVVPGATAQDSPFVDAIGTSVSHIYKNQGVRTIRITAIDEDGSYTVSRTVTVEDAAPSGEISSANEGRRVFEGQVYRLALSAADPGTGTEDTVDGWTINWGDGSAEQFFDGGETIASHVYADDGQYQISATIHQVDQQYSVSPLSVTVFDVAAKASLAFAPQINASTPFELDITSVVDPGDDDIGEVRVYWGDGSTFAGNDYQSFSSVGRFTHVYDESQGPFQVTVLLVDADDSERVALGGQLDVVFEGSEYELMLPMPSEAGQTLQVNWGDLTLTSFGLDELEVLTSNAFPATLSTRVEELDRNAIAYESGDQLLFEAIESQGRSAVRVLISNNLTMGSLIESINDGLDASSLVLTSTGQLRLIEDSTGALLPFQITDLPNLEIGDQTSFSRRTDWSLGIRAAHTYADNGRFLISTEAVEPSGTTNILSSNEIVVNNRTPKVEISLPSTVEAGIANIEDLIQFTDPGFDNESLNTTEEFTYEINWGDGSSIDSGSATVDVPGSAESPTQGSADGLHRYKQVGTFAVEVQVTDDEGATSSATSSIEITNVAPILEGLEISSASEGGTTELTGVIVDPGVLDTFTLEVNWGAPDSPNNIEVYEFGASDLGEQPFTLTHTYLDDNELDQYPVSLKIIDNFAEENSYNLDATVSNAAPELGNLEATAIVENGVTRLTGTILDAGIQDSFELRINWGDPSSAMNEQVVKFVSSSTGEQPFSIEHQYLDDGLSDSYVVNLEIIDDDDGRSVGSTSVAVENVAPAIELEAALPVAENSLFHLRGVFNDPGRFDTHTATINWGDGSVIEEAIVAGSPIAPGEQAVLTGSHYYADDGQYQVSVTVSDNDGGSSIATLDVEVFNSVPELVVGGPLNALEGAFVELEGITFSDAGFDFEPGQTLETFSARIDWGDGTQEPLNDIALLDNADGSAGNRTTGSIGATHAYGDNGNYVVTIGIRDDDMPEDTWVEKTIEVAVSNVAPAIDENSITNNSASCGGISERDMLHLTASFSDPGFDNPFGSTAEGFVANVDWGDGTVEQLAPDAFEIEQGREGALTLGKLTASHQYEFGGVYKIKIQLLDDDGGVTEETTTTQVVGVGLVNNVLYVIGSEGRDHVNLYENARKDELRVDLKLNQDRKGNSPKIKLKRTYDLSEVKRVVAHLCGGEDHYNGSHYGWHDVYSGSTTRGRQIVRGGSGDDKIVTGPAADRIVGNSGEDVIWAGWGDDHVSGGSGDDWIDGGLGDDLIQAGSGDDRVWGGAGSDIIVGGKGEDRIFGGLGRDVLIGGTGADHIYGQFGDDILISGRTQFDGNQRALRAIRDEWTQDRSFSDRVANLTGEGSDDRANADYFLKLGTNDATVFSDDSVDRVYGSFGADWLLTDQEDRKHP